MFFRRRPPAPNPMVQPPRRRRSLLGWLVAWIFGIIRRVIAMVVVFILVSFAAAHLIKGMDTGAGGNPHSENLILVLHIRDGLVEETGGEGVLGTLQELHSDKMSVRDMADTIHRAAADARVKALVVGIEGGEFGAAKVEELRSAIRDFRAHNKAAYAYSASYAEAGGTMGAYYLASAFDQIWMQPVGMLALPGFDAEMPFGLTALHKLGAEPQFFQRKEYKSVMENFSRDSMSPANREMTTSLLNDITDNMLAAIAADRKIGIDQLRADMDQGIFTDREAVNAKLVDRLDYIDVLVGELRHSLSDKASPDADDTGHDHQVGVMTLARYHDDHFSDDGDQDREGKPAIGLISAIGEIPSGDGSNDSEGGLAANRIAQAFAKARADKDIKAVVFRIDSPGGSPTGSETIRRAVARTVESGKPVIVSMGSMAGSGGYWIAADATRIFALPSTLTGSIGVASGKVDLGGLMTKLGITWDGVMVGRNADMWSMVKPFNAAGTERMNSMIDNMYAAFIERVSKGRKMDPAKVEQIAKGRVWTGRQGLSNGLVDELGGLDAALDYTARQLGEKSRDDVGIIHLPRQKTTAERLVDLLSGEAEMPKLGDVLMDFISVQMDQARGPKVSAYDPMLEQKL